MAKHHENPAPPADVNEQVAAGAQAAEVVPIRGGALVHNLLTNEIRKGNMLPPTADQHAPANFKMSKIAAERLQRVSSHEVSQVGRVDFVRAANVKSTKTVFIYPVKDDPNGIEVRWYRGSAWINLISLLETEDHVRQGYRRRYSVELVENSPVGPALMIDLGKPLFTRRIPRKKVARETAQVE